MAGRLEDDEHFGGLASRSVTMRHLFRVLGKIAKTDVTVTLIGETGSGKDVLARALHWESQRRAGPFEVFDCGAIAPSLAESELLGHERGAFTGAVVSYAGAFERAQSGTLFLDEIGELPLDLQPRLLRVLESRLVRRVGGAQDRPIDVRVIAATNRDLKAEVAAGRFRRDLYFRLAAAVISVPPLRERMEDVPILAYSLLKELGRTGVEISEGALSALGSHTWPGNVRELKNALACALAFVENHRLEAAHLHLLSQRERGRLEHLPLGGQTLQAIERAAIKQTLRETAGNKAHAARALGIAVSTLYEKLKKYEL